MPKNIRGLQSTKVKSQNKDEVVKKMGARIHDWLIIPSNAVITMCAISLSAFLLGKMFGVGPYLTIVAFLFSKFFLKQKEKAPLKIPVQEQLVDDHQPNPGTGKSEIGDGIFYIGTCTDQMYNNKEIWLNNDDARQHFLVLGTTGAGKTASERSVVFTPTGWRKLGDIKVGDYVTTPFDSTTAKITGVYPQGKRQLWKMTFKDGRTAEVGKEHLWEIHHKHWRGKYKPGVSRAGLAKPRIMTTQEVMELKQRNKGVFSVIIPDPVDKTPENLLIKPYTMGAFLGDGCLTKKQTLSICSADMHIINKVMEETSEHSFSFKDRTKKNKSANPFFEISYHSSTNENPLYKIFEHYNLIGTYSNSKFIPPEYLNGSLEQRIALFQGLMDTDGTCDSRKIALSYTTVSEQLAIDVQKLVWSLGGIATIVKKDKYCTHNGERKLGQLVYHVQIRLKNPKIAFSLPRKAELVAGDYQYEDLKHEIVSVEPLEKYEECVCIMVDHPRHLYIMDNYVVTHNTELLTGFAANALSWGSGLIFVDGKGDIKLMATLHALSMRWGRSADFMILNFMPQTDANAPGEISSNTMNPYTTSSASDIIQQIGGLMPASGGDGMWKDRAMTMISAVVYALAWARDNGLIDLNLAALRKYIQFRHLIELVTDEKFAPMPDNIKNNIHIYLSSLAGYNGKPEPEQGDDCLKQHGFLEMQFTGPLGSLANEYGHIFNSEYGEVDMFDVVLNRRILVVMLPSLQKMPEDVERMGKIVVASLKTMMGATLGNVGTTKGGKILDVMKRRVTTAPYPCLVILDEVGYYTVEGMAMMAAQVRSLGFSMIYASQDLKAMTRLNEKEAQSIIANTNTKIVMRTEDKETMVLAVEAGGQGERIKSGSYQIGEDVFGNAEWTQDKNFSINFENRINELDLKSQGPGEFTILHMDFIVRGRSFYVSTLSTFKDEDSVEVAPNQFIVVKRPDIDAVESDKKIPEILNKILDFPSINEAKNTISEEINQLPIDEIAIFNERMKEERKSSRGVQDQIGITLAYIFIYEESKTSGFVDKTRTIRRSQETFEEEFPDDIINNIPTRNHGIEVDNNGLTDIDDTMIASSDNIMDAIMDIPSTEEIQEFTDDEKITNLNKNLNADIKHEDVKNDIDTIKESDDLMNDIFNDIHQNEKKESYSDVGPIDNEDIVDDRKKEKTESDDTDQDSKSSSSNNTNINSSSNQEAESEDGILDLDSFLNAINKDSV